MLKYFQTDEHSLSFDAPAPAAQAAPPLLRLAQLSVIQQLKGEGQSLGHSLSPLTHILALGGVFSAVPAFCKPSWPQPPHLRLLAPGRPSVDIC